MAEQSNAQAVQQVTEAQLYEILGRVYVSWQVASRERAAYFQAAQQNFQAYQKAQRERDEAKANWEITQAQLDQALGILGNVDEVRKRLAWLEAQLSGKPEPEAE